ncbi:EXOSTOSIN HEPARAN SULFATE GLYCOSYLTRANSFERASE -RELATED [Salix purpurea]|uniref:EXOSTOSIN HEPARAN SULFATE GLYCOSYLTRANSFERASE -RELATED n=1 Tax=Salix purpurea TaxID=77065 RepID=A0A9Q0ZAB9_SALPP|nr:EXOSTOSIN HEPARAN SULFATE GLYCOSYLTRANSFERASE -RELATED [Salix purpurea]
MGVYEAGGNGSIGTTTATTCNCYDMSLSKPYLRSTNVGFGLNSLGCQEDNEGSWSIGVYYGDSPFSLKPIESMNEWRDEGAAWPVANPVVTCASLSDANFPSNFVADPFLYVQGKPLLEICRCRQKALSGLESILRAVSIPITVSSALWVLFASGYDLRGIHFSYSMKQKIQLPCKEILELQKVQTRERHGNSWALPWMRTGIYLIPMCSTTLAKYICCLRAARKGNFAFIEHLIFHCSGHWRKFLLKSPLLILLSLIMLENIGFFGSDHSGIGTRKNGQLEIWCSSSPLGPWKPHKKNPIYNVDKSVGARNGGRPFVYDGNLYRVGQDCGETYGRRVRIFKIEVLTKDDYKEVEVPLGFEEPSKGRNAWNGARYHHLDVQHLTSGKWIAVMDGDRVPSGDPVHRFILGSASLAAVTVVAVVLGVLLGAVKCIIPLNWCAHYSGKRNYILLGWERSNLFSSKVRRFCSRLNRVLLSVRGKMKPSTWFGKLVIAVTFVVGVALMCRGVKYFYGGNDAEEAYPLNGHYSQFTLLTMTYDARLWNLKMYVKHYSRCSSVKEIIVVWNKGRPPRSSDLDSAVPVWIRVEDQNSLNNRFKKDPMLKTRAVLELDDDIMMRCDDIERGFNVWRQHPDRIVGFYPRLISGSPLKYRAEKYARRHKGYNMILTGAAFMDHTVAFERYWSNEAKAGRELVDRYFNCEDVLLNYLYANASSSQTVEYVRPAWVIDTSKFSGVAISRNTNVHYKIRSSCLLRFSEIYGSIADRKWEFDGRKDGWGL